MSLCLINAGGRGRWVDASVCGVDGWVEEACGCMGVGGKVTR